MSSLGRLSSALAALLLLLAASPGASVPPAGAGGFVDVAAAAGVDQPHGRRLFHHPYAAVMAGYTAIGAAVAVADVDGDGREDLFVTDSAETGKNHLYRNTLGGMRFTDVAAAAGVADGNDAANASADALFFDYDDDGRPDLFVARFGRSQLFHNEGGGRFRDVSRAAGVDAYANAIAAIAFDYDRDGRLDLLVGNYFAPVDVFSPATPRFFPESFETAGNGGGVTLWRNLGPGAAGQVTFADVTDAAGLRQSGWTLDIGAGDADNDGDLDLYVACDFGTDRFFVNRGDGTFADRTATAMGYDTKKGMNAEWGDYDGDGWLDVFVTNITDDYLREGNILWRNDGKAAAAGGPSFSDVAAETGTRDTGWGWGAKLFDYDDDGWLDLYALDGWVSAGKESYVPAVAAMILRLEAENGGDFSDARDWPPLGDKSLSGYQRNKLFHNEGGQLFREVGAPLGVDSLRDGRGLAVADLDGDGRLDLFVTNAGAAPHLFRNEVKSGAHWLGLELEGRAGGQGADPGGNRDAIGAQVRLTAGGRTQLHFVDPGNGFAAQGSRRLHFGLGPAATVERVEVLWPSGRLQVLPPLAVDRLQRVVEGENRVEPIDPSAPVATAGATAAAAPATRAEPAPAGEPARRDDAAASSSAPASAAPTAESPTSAAPTSAAPTVVAPTATPPPGAAASPAPADCDAELRRLEAAVRAAPGDLRLGSDYRHAVIPCGAYDRALAFFAALTTAHPRSAPALLNHGYAYVDKIPTVGSVTRVILADAAMALFSRAVDVEPSWLALFTRGNSYLFWPQSFGRAPRAVADLERAAAMARAGPLRPYHLRGWIALGDAYWKADRLAEARGAWEEGLWRFPGEPRLLARLRAEGEALAALVESDLDPRQRVDTDLSALEESP